MGNTQVKYLNPCEPLASVSPPPAKGGHGPLGPTPRGMVPMAPMAPKGTRNREVTHGRFPQDGTHGAHGHPLLWGQGVGPPHGPPLYTLGVLLVSFASKFADSLGLIGM